MNNTTNTTNSNCPNCPVLSERTGELLNIVNDLPSLSLISEIADSPLLADSDIDLNLPFDTNFKYYSPHDFHSDLDINECSSNSKSFSALVTVILEV